MRVLFGRDGELGAWWTPAQHSGVVECPSGPAELSVGMENHVGYAQLGVPRRTAAACGTLRQRAPCEPHDVLRSGLVRGELRTVLIGELLEFIVELVADRQRLVDVGAQHDLGRRVAA